MMFQNGYTSNFWELNSVQKGIRELKGFISSINYNGPLGRSIRGREATNGVAVVQFNPLI